MKPLDFVGRDAESDALLFSDAEGNRYAAPLTDGLWAAVIKGSSLALEVEEGTPLAPRDIQALLRSGLSAEQVAEQTGTDLERVRRYEGPVLAEIGRAIRRVQASYVGGDRGAPRLGDLVLDRLAQAGAEPDTLSWSALRRADGTWEVTASFITDSVQKTAAWELVEATGGALALDDTARELTETERPAEPIRALFPPVSAGAPERGDASAEALLERQESLLRRLDAARGKRQPLVIDGEGGDTGVETVVAELEEVTVKVEARSKTWSEVLAGSEDEVEEETPERPTPKEVKPVEKKEPSAAPAPVKEEPATTVLSAEAAEPTRKRRRTPVPSWDEIVFGSRGEG